MADMGEYSCRRMFVFNTMDGVPTLRGAQVKECGGVFGVMTDGMTENEVSRITAACGNKLVSVYRVL
jgi:hypothetical protein